VLRLFDTKIAKDTDEENFNNVLLTDELRRFLP